MWTSLDDLFHRFAESVVLYGAAIMAIWYGLKRVYNVAKNIDIVTDYVTERKKKDKENDALITRLAMEVSPNGGSSMKDTLTRVSSMVSEINGRMTALEQWKKDMGG